MCSEAGVAVNLCRPDHHEGPREEAPGSRSTVEEVWRQTQRLMEESEHLFRIMTVELVCQLIPKEAWTSAVYLKRYLLAHAYLIFSSIYYVSISIDYHNHIIICLFQKEHIA